MQVRCEVSSQQGAAHHCHIAAHGVEMLRGRMGGNLDERGVAVMINSCRDRWANGSGTLMDMRMARPPRLHSLGSNRRSLGRPLSSSGRRPCGPARHGHRCRPGDAQDRCAGAGGQSRPSRGGGCGCPAPAEGFLKGGRQVVGMPILRQEDANWACLLAV